MFDVIISNGPRRGPDSCPAESRLRRGLATGSSRTVSLVNRRWADDSMIHLRPPRPSSEVRHDPKRSTTTGLADELVMTPLLKSPLFLVGAGRCGTTLLFQALAAHPRIGLTNEAHVADFLCFASRVAGVPDDERADFEHEEPVRLRGIVTREFTQRFSSVFSDHAPRMFAEFYERTFPEKDLRWFGDKMPNPSVARAVQESVPGTRILTLVRDPWDYVCSARSYARRPDIARAYPHLDVSTRFHAEHWRNVYQVALAREGPAGPIRYEELVRDPAAVVRRTLSSLGLDEHPACLDALRDDELFRRQATSPTPEASVGRASRDLQSVDAQVVEDVCGDLPAIFGYRRTEVGGTAS